MSRLMLNRWFKQITITENNRKMIFLMANLLNIWTVQVKIRLDHTYFFVSYIRQDFYAMRLTCSFEAHMYINMHLLAGKISGYII